MHTFAYIVKLCHTRLFRGYSLSVRYLLRDCTGLRSPYGRIHGSRRDYQTAEGLSSDGCCSSFHRSDRSDPAYRRRSSPSAERSPRHGGGRSHVRICPHISPARAPSRRGSSPAPAHTTETAPATAATAGRGTPATATARAHDTATYPRTHLGSPCPALAGVSTPRAAPAPRHLPYALAPLPAEAR